MTDVPASLCELTLAEAACLVRSRAASPVELVSAALDRIEALEPTVRAFITRLPERALDAARAAEREIVAGRLRGPLHGVPYGLKDLYDTAGILTTGHSRIGMDRIPTHDAAVVEKLRLAGAVLVGKLATYEFAHGGHSEHTPWPAPRNPRHLGHATGGSSSGSAAAVAARMLPFALGTDTGGSIRIPAAFTGIAGFKPTYGLVSRRGVIPNAFGFDHCGPLARTAEDCALVLDAIAGHDAADPASRRVRFPPCAAALGEDLRGLRVGVLRHLHEEDLVLDEAAARAVDDTAATLARLGARVSTARVAPLREYDDVKVVLAESEIFSVHAADLADRLHDFGREFLDKTLAGALFGAADYVNAQRERRRLLDAAARLHDTFDLLLAAGGNPPRRTGIYRVLDAWKVPSLHTPFSVTGAPTLSICAGYTEAGLPLAVQVAGRPGEDATVLRAGYALERATGWHGRPPAFAGTPADPPPAEPPSEAEPAVRDAVAARCALAGIAPDTEQFARLCAVAPHAFAMARRLARRRPYAQEPAAALRPAG